MIHILRAAACVTILLICPTLIARELPIWSREGIFERLTLIFVVAFLLWMCFVTLALIFEPLKRFVSDICEMSKADFRSMG